ncbi:MAG TPA: hypothetical protein VEW03_05270 [Longimicrobiaceae bacterium]|nr:hypothetical protein [Longimicrobiaceae bacterium]
MSDPTPPPPPYSGPYSRGGPATEAELRFTPKRMVQWLNPKQLSGTAVRAALGSVFGSYADQREVQAALRQPRTHDYSGEGELWLDYTSDLGDGFRSSYSIAWLLAQGRLTLAQPDGAPGPETPRGRILVMGGDQVYPTASKQEYRDRLEGPYEAALPCHAGADNPHLYVIPGNHDWYDGLTSFTRLFMQGRWIGGWETRQSRSYWALKLPHGWWVLGTDIQLQADIDHPQLEYFCGVAGQMQPGDRVILCTAEPAWVHTPQTPACYDTLAFFERAVLQPHGVELTLTLTGDLHHYARYSDDAGTRHKLTAGGGGAYLYGTHTLPQELELPERTGGRDVKARWRCRETYPSRRESLRLRAQALPAPLANPGFALLLAGLYAFFAWMVQSASESMGNVKVDGGKADFIDQLGSLHWTDAPLAALYFGKVLQHSPEVAIFATVIVIAWWVFCTPDAGRPGWLKGLGLVHGLAHVALAVTLMWAFTWFNVTRLGMEVTDLRQAALFIVEMVVFGGTLGALLVGLFLLPAVNFNEAFSAQHRTGWKNFLRLHVARDGTLTVYPVGVRRAGSWEFVPHAPAGQPFFRPAAGRAPEPRLIEPPIRIAAPQRQIVVPPDMGVVAAA